MKDLRISNIEQGIVNEEGSSYAYDLEERLISFAVLVCKIAEKLPSNKVGNHVAGQLIRSGTSPAANYGEAQGAESRRDFIHKMKVCLKELRETHVWLTFIKRMGLLEPAEMEVTLEEANELIAIFVKSIVTVRRHTKTKPSSSF
ncbi:MAG: four helix bundle protein [Rhodothermales bacterium]